MLVWIHIFGGLEGSNFTMNILNDANSYHTFNSVFISKLDYKIYLNKALYFFVHLNLLSKEQSILDKISAHARLTVCSSVPTFEYNYFGRDCHLKNSHLYI